MRKHEDIFGQVSRLAVAVALCIAAMLAVYALAGRFTNTVLLGALIGFVLAMGNFISLCITVSNALDRTVKGDNPQKAQLQIQSSGVIRLVVLVIIYILLFRAKFCDPLAAILPLLFAQVSLKLIEFFRKDESEPTKRTVIPPHEWSENLLYHTAARRHRHYPDDRFFLCGHGAALHGSRCAGRQPSKASRSAAGAC